MSTLDSRDDASAEDVLTRRRVLKRMAYVPPTVVVLNAAIPNAAFGASGPGSIEPNPREQQLAQLRALREASKQQTVQLEQLRNQLTVLRRLSRRP